MPKLSYGMIHVLTQTCPFYTGPGPLRPRGPAVFGSHRMVSTDKFEVLRPGREAESEGSARNSDGEVAAEEMEGTSEDRAAM